MYLNAKQRTLPAREAGDTSDSQETQADKYPGYWGTKSEVSIKKDVQQKHRHICFMKSLVLLTVRAEIIHIRCTVK